MANEQAQAQETDDSIGRSAAPDAADASRKALNDIRDTMRTMTPTQQDDYLKNLSTAMDQRSRDLLPMLALTRLKEEADKSGGTADISKLEGSGVGINARGDKLDKFLAGKLRERPELLDTLKKQGRGEQVQSADITKQLEAFKQRRSQAYDVSQSGDARFKAADVLMKKDASGRTLFDRLAYSADKLYPSDLDKAINNPSQFGVSQQDRQILQNLKTNFYKTDNGFWANGHNTYLGMGEGYIQSGDIAKNLGFQKPDGTGDLASLQTRLGQARPTERPVVTTKPDGTYTEQYSDRTVTGKKTNGADVAPIKTVFNNRPGEEQIDYPVGHTRAGLRDIVRTTPQGKEVSTTYPDSYPTEASLAGKTKTVATDNNNNVISTTVADKYGNSTTDYKDGTKVTVSGSRMDILSSGNPPNRTVAVLGATRPDGTREIDRMAIRNPGQQPLNFIRDNSGNLVGRNAAGEQVSLQNAVMKADGTYQFTQDGKTYQQRPDKADVTQVTSQAWSDTTRGDKVLTYPGNLGTMKVQFDRSGEPERITAANGNQRADQFVKSGDQWLRNGVKVDNFNFNKETGEIKYTQNRNETTIDAQGRRLLTGFTYPDGGQVKAKYSDGKLTELTRPSTSGGNETLSLQSDGMWKSNRSDQLLRNVTMNDKGRIQVTDSNGTTMETTPKAVTRLAAAELVGNQRVNYSYDGDSDTQPRKIERKDNGSNNVAETLTRDSSNNWTRTKPNSQPEKIGAPVIDKSGSLTFVNKDRNTEAWGVTSGNPVARADLPVQVTRSGDTLRIRHATGENTLVKYDSDVGAQRGQPREITYLGEPRETFTRADGTNFKRTVNGVTTDVQNVQVDQKTGSITYDEVGGRKMELHPSGKTVVKEMNYPDNSGGIKVQYNDKGQAIRVDRTDPAGKRTTYTGNQFKMDVATGAFTVGTGDRQQTFHENGEITKNGVRTKPDGATIPLRAGDFTQPDGNRVNFTVKDGKVNQVKFIQNGVEETFTPNGTPPGSWNRVKDGRTTVVKNVDATPDKFSFEENGKRYTFNKDGTNTVADAATNRVTEATRTVMRGGVPVREPIDVANVQPNPAALEKSGLAGSGTWGVANEMLGRPTTAEGQKAVQALSKALLTANGGVDKIMSMRGGTKLARAENKQALISALESVVASHPQLKSILESVRGL